MESAHDTVKIRPMSRDKAIEAATENTLWYIAGQRELKRREIADGLEDNS